MRVLLPLMIVAVLVLSFNACQAKKRDYYTVLEVDRSATKQEIKKAFRWAMKLCKIKIDLLCNHPLRLSTSSTIPILRKMALRYHPDKNPGEDTTKKFREVAEAYEVLGDEQKRKMYDGQGHNAWAGEGAGGYKPGNFDFDDLFKVIYRFWLNLKILLSYHYPIIANVISLRTLTKSSSRK